jgi:hypothetical protein
MGSEKQAAALINLINGERRKNLKGHLNPQQVAEVTAKVLAMPLSEVRAEFDKLNAVTGFKRDTADATLAQRRRLSQLEIGVYGASRTTWTTALTFLEASDRITALIDTLSAMRAGVKGLEQHANAPTDSVATAADRS